MLEGSKSSQVSVAVLFSLRRIWIRVAKAAQGCMRSYAENEGEDGAEKKTFKTPLSPEETSNRVGFCLFDGLLERPGAIVH